MDLGPLIPIAGIMAGVAWGLIGLQHRKLKLSEHGSTKEAEQLRAENRKLADRIAVLERIATDEPSRLAAEIDRLGGSLPSPRSTAPMPSDSEAPTR